ncbi:MAG: FAD-containing monooxygenase EthA [Massilia sp.]|jgi:monooxygenase|nr:FAD-containing monooxygenase EthA [Massilia sp.]
MTEHPPPPGEAILTLDVLIVGAGLSGIGAAVQLQRACPGKRYAILEARSSLGGTWDLFRYPGVRSDSDMHTLGYRFKPWTAPKAIADGAAILAYVRETADENGVAKHIRFGSKAVAASWSSVDACWTVTVDDVSASAPGRPDATPTLVRARFLYCCSGYYSYDEAYRPRFDGEESFQGELVVPQFWPKDVDYAGKRVVVIGSGATAVTIVPSMAHTAAHVTMLQRTPTYVITRPAEDKLAHRLQRVLPAGLAYAATRWKNVLISMFYYRLARSRPHVVKQRLVQMAAQQIGPGVDASHFTPNYKPWDQRVCVVPDGDLFRALRDGRATVVTDTIARFTPGGILLGSGPELPADVVVVATGLALKVLGGIAISVDGRPFDASGAMAYKGMMLSELPNFAMAFGYTNASWTLKADLTAGYVCRLLNYMDRRGVQIAVARRQAGVESLPFLNFTSGYVQRAAHLLPSQGSRRPWQVYQNYVQDLLTIRYGRIDDGVMRFGTKGQLP